MTDFAAIRHLLIDLDGTLLGNRELPLRLDFAFRALYSLKRHGGWIKAVKTLRAIYFELDQVPVEIKQGLTNDKRAVAAFAKAVGLPITDAAQILTKSVAELFPLLKRHFYPIPGAKEFLNWAKDHYPLTLATNPVWPEELVVLRLEWAGIDPSIFKNITHAGIMHACKPASEYYREI